MLLTYSSNFPFLTCLPNLFSSHPSLYPASQTSVTPMNHLSLVPISFFTCPLTCFLHYFSFSPVSSSSASFLVCSPLCDTSPALLPCTLYLSPLTRPSCLSFLTFLPHLPPHLFFLISPQVWERPVALEAELALTLKVLETKADSSLVDILGQPLHTLRHIHSELQACVSARGTRPCLWALSI